MILEIYHHPGKTWLLLEKWKYRATKVLSIVKNWHQMLGQF